ncbi:unnamed protein product [Adineta ricciae]|uniref:Uncharacterized protein n=1 Tax=Adineta ricciae TaxID=249248 RepID=A0A815HW40_ADIRI|nr:unnamed protein product [Adineta ricciae]CAF1357803.1 unnamed protein product [Adineta ricciae]
MSSEHRCCDSTSFGPGYKSSLDAMQNGPHEEYLYIVMISCDETKPDYLATIDINPHSSRYQQVVSRVYAQQPQDEFHHFGWNTCSSCHGDQEKKRRFLIIGTLKSSCLYIIDTADVQKQKIHKIIHTDELKKWDLSAPHTIHCLGMCRFFSFDS